MEQGNFAYGEASGLADLESYLAARLLWDPDRDEDQIIDEFIRGVYGEECYPFVRRYVDLLCDALPGNKLTLYQNSNASYITDGLVDEAERLFEKALSVVRDEKSRRHLEKEYLSVLFMKASRMPLDSPERDRLIDTLYEGVKRFGITEIRERKHLDICFDSLRRSRYAESSDGEYLLYYIMK